MIIRSMLPQDTSSIEKILSESGSFKQPYIREQFTYVVCEIEGRVVGVGSYTQNDGFIQQLGVPSNQQGKGIGSALMQHLEDKIRKHCSSVNVHSTAEQIKFYISKGYEHASLLPNPTGLFPLTKNFAYQSTY